MQKCTSCLLLLLLPGLAAASSVSAFVGIWQGPLPWINKQTPATKDIDNDVYKRTTVYFPCKGETCEAWLYLPKPKANPCKKPPIIVMAHGLGGQKDFSLHHYASRFAEEGFASFVFDYRTFGGSTGEPRLWVSPRRHLQDWDEAMAYVKANLGGKVDLGKIALWGTSFSGGHVIKVAAKWKEDVKAVVSQVPHLSGESANLHTTLSMGIKTAALMSIVGLYDAVRIADGDKEPALYAPIAGPKGSFAFMQLSEEEMKDYYSLHPANGTYQGGWQPLARASLAVELYFDEYSPIEALPHVRAPIHFTAATKDTLCEFKVQQMAMLLARNATLHTMDINHFQPYLQPYRAEVLKEQAAFLRDTVQPRSCSSA